MEIKSKKSNRIWLAIAILVIAIIVAVVVVAFSVKKSDDVNPSAESSKEDRERFKKSDESRKTIARSIVDSLSEYQTDNRGNLPSNSDEWENFTQNYIKAVPSLVQTYRIVEPCEHAESDSSCVEPTSFEWNENTVETYYVTTKATCDGSTPSGLRYLDNPRKAAVYVMLALEKYYCYNN